MKGYVAVFAPGPPNELGGELIGFRGPGLPGPRRVDRKRKAADRLKRKRLRNRKGRR